MTLYQKIIAHRLVLAGLVGLFGCEKSEVPHINYVSWVQDGEKGKMEMLIEKMNMDVERGIIKSPKGSKYLVGAPRSGKNEELGIYFFDSTRSN